MPLKISVSFIWGLGTMANGNGLLVDQATVNSNRISTLKGGLLKAINR